MKPSQDSISYQAVLDMAARVQLRRSTIIAELEAGQRVDGVRVVGSGPALNVQMMHESRRWRHLLSVRQVTTVANLRASLPNNRRTLADGLKMTSLFDWSATTPAARVLLAKETPGVYFFTRAPLQLKILDMREVLIEGPQTDGHPSVIAVAASDMLVPALQYWHALVTNAVPAWSENHSDGFTPRQRRVLELLQQELTDHRIADVLGISVRTVRYDIADVMSALETRSRFTAGLRLGSSSAWGE